MRSWNFPAKWKRKKPEGQDNYSISSNYLFLGCDPQTWSVVDTEQYYPKVLSSSCIKISRSAASSLESTSVGRSRVPGSGDKTRRSASPLLCNANLRLNDPVRPPWEENLTARQEPHKPRWPTAQTNKSAPPLPPANLDGSFTFPVVGHPVTWISVLRKLQTVTRGSNASIRHAIDWGSCVTDQPDTRGDSHGSCWSWKSLCRVMLYTKLVSQIKYQIRMPLYQITLRTLLGSASNTQATIQVTSSGRADTAVDLMWSRPTPPPTGPGHKFLTKTVYWPRHTFVQRK